MSWKTHPFAPGFACDWAYPMLRFFSAVVVMFSLCGIPNVYAGSKCTPTSCDDADPCTIDTCDPAIGCSYSAVPNSAVVGTSCDGSDLGGCKSGVLACRTDGTGVYCKGDGPSAMYRLEEGSGQTVLNGSGQAPNGIFQGSPQWVTGQTGGGLSFDAKNDGVLVPNSPSIQLSAPLSVGVWVQFTAAATPLTTLVRQGTAVMQRYWLQASGAGKFICGFGGTNLASCQVTVAGVDMTSFHHVLCTYDGTKVDVVLDGLLQKSCPASGALLVSAGPLMFGALDQQPPAAIVLDDPSIWDTCLNVTQAAMLTNEGEACDGVDNDCDGIMDESFPGKSEACDGDDADKCTLGTSVCAAHQTALICQGDVNQVDFCDNKDNDCDGETDEDYPTLGQACDSDSDPDLCANGMVYCMNTPTGVGCLGDVNVAEICDNVDNDCNGITDDHIANVGVACEGNDMDNCVDGITYCDSSQKQILCDDVRSALWLAFEEAVGFASATDSSRHGLSMTAQNTTFGIAGKMANAVQFDQAGRIVDADNTFDLLANKTEATWAAWVYPSTTFGAQQAQTIVAQWGTGANARHFVFRLRNQGLELGLRTTGDVADAPLFYGCIPGINACTTVIPEGSWTHVAAVFQDSTVKLYVNGTLVRAVTTKGSAIADRTAADILHVGAQNAQLQNGFHGRLDDVVVYPRALNALQIADLVGTDIGGWTLRGVSNTGTVRDYTFEAGTVVPMGGVVVVARNASKTAFEAHWGSLPGNALYFSGSNKVPIINGTYTFTLLNPFEKNVDGPTVTPNKKVLQRMGPDVAAGLESSWSVVPEENATPGANTVSSTMPSGHKYISEMADASGSGNYNYEFVELHFTGGAGPSGLNPEMCNGEDDDCDDSLDEEYQGPQGLGTACDGPDADQCAGGSRTCNGQQTGVVCDDSSAVLDWRCDDLSGLVVQDHSGGGHDALLHGDAALVSAGKVGGAVLLSGASSTYGDAAKPDLLGGKAAATWMAWIKPGSVAAGRSVIVSTHGPVAGNYGKTWAFGRDGKELFLRLRTNTTVGDSPPVYLCKNAEGCTLKTNQWSHVAVVYKPPTTVFYFNGEPAAGHLSTGTIIAAKDLSERLMLGADQAGEYQSWGGKIDDVRVYPVGLTPKQIKSEYDASFGVGLEQCDGKDNDCDGDADEDFPDKDEVCDGLDTDDCENGTWTCTSDGDALECINESVTNIYDACNGLDDDCDGKVDENFPLLNQACDGSDADGCTEGIFICSSDATTVSCVHDGPIVWWPMSDGAGTFAHDFSGSPFNDLALTTDVSWTAGKSGGGLEFTGVNSFATAANTFGGTRTIELWVNPGGATPGYVYGQSTNAKIHFGGLWAGGTFTHSHVEASGTTRTVSGDLAAGGWHHVVVVMNPIGSEGLKLYIDGSLQDTSTLLSNTAMGEFTLGAIIFSPINDVFVGSVDEVAVYDFEMPKGMVEEHAAQGIPAGMVNRELCDGKDNDCNGTVDDKLDEGVPGAPCDGADADECAKGSFTCMPNMLDVECINDEGGVEEEVCNGVDDDCDSSTDEGFVFDGLPVGTACDPPGVCGAGLVECISTQVAGCSTGIDGSQQTTAAEETCDQLDNDCDGVNDEKADGTPLTETCYTGPEGTEGVGTCIGGLRSCSSGTMGACKEQTVPSALDSECDQLDQDCDGTADEDYADNILCTVDTCVAGVKSSVPSDAACDDANPCTDDKCTAAVAQGSGCEYTTNNTNVPDPIDHACQNSCQVPTCVNGSVQCIDVENAVPDDGLWCTVDKCELGNAIHKIDDGTCLIGGACFAAAAVNPESGCKVCAPEVDQENWSRNLQVADFDKGLGNADGYTFEELVNGGVSWGVNPVKFVTPVGEDKGYSLYFGGANQSYHTGVRVAASASSATTHFPVNVKVALSFYVWMETEGYTGSEKFDALTVDVLEVATNTRTQVWDSMTTLGSNTDAIFEKVYIDLSAWAGLDVKLVFTFDSGDGYFNKYEGVYLDKIRVDTACCFSSSDCDHANGVNTCVTNWCDAATKQCLFEETCLGCVTTQSSVIFLIDKSASMTALTSTGETRWEITKKAIKSALTQYDEHANMGFKLYPTRDATDQCLVSEQLDLDFHSSVDEALEDMLAPVVPSGQTPMAAALQEAFKAYSSPAAQAESGTKHVVLMTDGIETCSGEALAQVEQLAAIGVRTLIVAFDSETTRPLLTDMSVAGLMAKPVSNLEDTVYYRATDLDSLVDGLTQLMSLTTGEACNGVDDNCDGTIDNAVPAIACNLSCNGGLGGQKTCMGGQYTDCSIKKVDELCDGLDNDCDGLTDESWPTLGKPCSVGSGDCISIGQYICSPFLTGPVICDAPAKQSVTEVCDGKDNDCDGLTDEDIYQVCQTSCGTGYEVCKNGVFSNCTAVAVTEETCNGLDDDCNSVVDDIKPISCTGVCGTGFKLCVNGVLAGCSTDGVNELCDGLDNDCDGFTDEGVDGGTLELSCIANSVCKDGIQKCLPGGVSGPCVPLQVASSELCDGLDNDCDGLTDEGVGGDPVSIECYSGPSGTLGIGACKSGKRLCGPGGSYGVCTEEVTPSAESCDGIDNDCDGSADENPGGICKLEPGCAAGYCLCGPDQSGDYYCYLD